MSSTWDSRHTVTGWGWNNFLDNWALQELQIEEIIKSQKFEKVLRRPEDFATV